MAKYSAQLKINLNDKRSIERQIAQTLRFHAPKDPLEFISITIKLTFKINHSLTQDFDLVFDQIFKALFKLNIIASDQRQFFLNNGSKYDLSFKEGNGDQNARIEIKEISRPL